MPNQINLLAIASSVYRASGDYEKSLQYADHLIARYPEKCQGYVLAIDLFIIKGDLDGARLIAEKGASCAKENAVFFALLSDIAHAQGEEEVFDRYERIWAQKVYSEDVYSKLMFAPVSIKPLLKAEYASVLSEKSFGMQNKPDLYILAGFSGCGKTTLLNTSNFCLEKIFSTRPVDIKMKSADIVEFLRRRRSIVPGTAAMLFSNCFGFGAIESLCKQGVLPKQTLVTIDLTNFFLSPFHVKNSEGRGMELDDLSSSNALEQYFWKIFPVWLLDLFDSISVATMKVGFDKNAQRYINRSGSGGRYYFDSGMKIAYDSMMRAWHEQIAKLPVSVNNIIYEQNGYYAIRQRA